MEIDAKFIGTKLSELRIKKGLNKTQVADKLGVNMQSYANWENGNKSPSLKAIRNLAHFYNVSIDYLIGDESKSDTKFSPLEALKHTYSADGKPVPEEDLETLARIIETTIRSKNNED